MPVRNINDLIPSLFSDSNSKESNMVNRMLNWDNYHRGGSEYLRDPISGRVDTVKNWAYKLAKKTITIDSSSDGYDYFQKLERVNRSKNRSPDKDVELYTDMLYPCEGYDAKQVLQHTLTGEAATAEEWAYNFSYGSHYQIAEVEKDSFDNLIEVQQST